MDPYLTPQNLLHALTCLVWVTNASVDAAGHKVARARRQLAYGNKKNVDQDLRILKEAGLDKVWLCIL